jgi:hypothetical protein
LSADGSSVLKGGIDASFAVHPKMHGHSGSGLSLGRGFPIASSMKQKLNTCSLTETEVVGVNDFMPAIYWLQYFMEVQGYIIEDNIVQQDNKSSMLLEKNGKALSMKRTKHINIHYFFVTDQITKGEIHVKWCPTAKMIGDYMTKLLQGAMFKKFCDLIMGVCPANIPKKLIQEEKIKKPEKKDLAPSKKKERHHRSVLDSNDRHDRIKKSHMKHHNKS